jgi:PIN domain nuclease of toxin-antitoxin system
MKFLIDTHTFLWLITDNPQLSSLAKETLESDIDLLVCGK